MNKLLFKKAFRDLFSNKGKAIRAIAAILIGMIAFGTLLFSYEIITNELVTTYSSINSPSASISVSHIDSNFLKLTQNYDGIAEYEVKTHYQLRGKKANGEWTTVELFASDNYSDLKMNKVFYMDGNINPELNEMLIERDAINVAGKDIGDTLCISLPNGKDVNLKITGVINDLSVHPATMHNTIYAYVSTKTLESMELYPNKIDFKINGNPYVRKNILTISNEYMRMLEKNGYQITGLSVENTPGVSMHLEEYKTALFMLRAFSFIAFLFGCLIMVSLITAILSQQVKQIGILKALGAKQTSITVSYIMALFSLIGIAGIISLPVSKTLANIISSLLLRVSNMTLTHTHVSPFLYIIFLLLCFTIPLLIAFFSIRRATKITIKDAINNAGIKNNYLPKPLFFRFTWLQRPVILTLRNAFRKKSRFYLNTTTLAISGVCFIAVFVSMFSVISTLNNNMNTFKYDYHFIAGNTDKEQMEQVFNKFPDIGIYEYWGYTSGKLLDDDGQTGNSYAVSAIPKDSKLVAPDLLKGGWLQENGKNEIVVGHEFLQNNPDISLGDTINLDIDGTNLKLRIIGIIKDFSGSNIYMDKSFYVQNVPNQSKQDIVQIHLDSKLKGRSRANLLQEIEEALLRQNISILQSETKTNAIKILNSHYMATFQTFLIIIFMVLIVSAFGLSSTTNIQTLERTKEIGIMKSMGANKKQIIKIITSESVFVGLSGWALSALLSIPAITIALAYFSAITLETSVKLNWIAVFAGYIIWLLLALFIGKKTSKRSALRAANMTIKDSLFSN